MTGTDTDTELVMLLVAKKVKSKRQSLGMSQQELSEKVGVTRASITNIERGHQNITIKNLVKVADAFNCDISDLLPRIR